jgi:hypothetical protein
MEPENLQVTMAAPDAPTAGPTYTTLLLRLWLVRARLRARAGVRVIRPHDTADDRRLAAVLVAAGVAVITLIGCAVAGFTAATCVVITGVGFFIPLGCGLALLLGPDDFDCEAELAEVTGLLPEAKRLRDAARAARRAERAARKQAARKAQQATRKQATRKQAMSGVISRGQLVANPAETAGLVELGPVGGPPPESAALEGDGTYAVPVLAEVHVGRILAAVCHELPAVGQDEVVSAVVRIESTKRESPAVLVEIAGRQVGHLSRADAEALLRRAGQNSGQFPCWAVIHAAWKRGRVHYDLRLDLNLGADRPSGDVSL